MDKWFEKQSRLVQIILLLIPGVNWIVEILVRWSHYIKKQKTINLIGALVVTLFGIVLGWVDIIFCLLFKRIFCYD